MCNILGKPVQKNPLWAIYQHTVDENIVGDYWGHLQVNSTKYV